MPGVSTSLRVSKDGQYIMAAGIYKPRIKCFDVNNLSLKFERCLDSEVVTFEILSEDYSKVCTVTVLWNLYCSLHLAHMNLLKTYLFISIFTFDILHYTSLIH